MLRANVSATNNTRRRRSSRLSGGPGGLAVVDIKTCPPLAMTKPSALIDQRINQEIDGMLAAAGYLSGVSGAYTAELAKKHEAQTASG